VPGTKIALQNAEARIVMLGPALAQGAASLRRAQESTRAVLIGCAILLVQNSVSAGNERGIRQGSFPRPAGVPKTGSTIV
jgi:hypothetical protein